MGAMHDEPGALQIGAHVLGQHRYRAPGDDGKTGHTQSRLEDDLDMDVSQACPPTLVPTPGVSDSSLTRVPKMTEVWSTCIWAFVSMKHHGAWHTVLCMVIMQ